MTDPEIYCGVDLGSQKTTIVASDGERILTSTGGTSRITAVSFYDRSRLLGEDALPQMLSENTVTFLNTLLGASYRDVMDGLSDEKHERFGFLPFTRMSLVPLGGSCPNHSDSLVGLRVAYSGPGGEQEQVFSVPALLGMFLGSLVQQVRASYGEHNGHRDTNRFVLSIPLPHGHSPEAARALREACTVAGISVPASSSSGGGGSSSKVPGPGPMTALHITTSTQSLARAYSRKLQGLKPAEKAHLQDGGKVLVVDMGCLQTSVLVLRVEPDLTSVQVLATACCASLGAFHFDLAIFRHLALQCEQKHRLTIKPGTKAGMRFLAACERLRKLLSQLPEASVTIEHLSEEVGDLSFALRRDELAGLCSPLISRIRALVEGALAEAGSGPLSAVEVLGGGVRMHLVQEALKEFSGNLPLGAKLDDGSVGVGAALVAMPLPVHPTASVPLKSEEGVGEVDTEVESEAVGESDSKPEMQEARLGLSEQELLAAVAAEARMRQQDAEIVRLLESRNEMEAYIFEMRGCSSQKHGALIADAEALRATCDEFEGWLWDNGETTSLQDLEEKFCALKDMLEGPEVSERLEQQEGDGAGNQHGGRARAGGLCSEYLAVVAAEKQAVEQSLADEAAQASREHADAGGEDDDHDFRKLRKPERMRLVTKNKDEGTELFKGGNVRPAAARYQKALTHAAKFFDLSPEDAEEVAAVKLSLHLNLTQCYLKLENWDSATRHADEALLLDENSVKALFRRAQAREARRQYPEALADMRRAAELTAPKEDKLISKGMERVRKLIQKEKEKEKKTWGKAFSS